MAALRLGVNVDHVATLRNARGGAAPDPVRAARIAIDAGADGITAHLREDRRHIHDDDMRRLKASITKPLNFEMAATEAMLDIALRIRPHACCLVPERRTERTTEGGLDVVGGFQALKFFVAELGKAGIRVSMFVEPSSEALKASADLGETDHFLMKEAWCLAVSNAEASAREIINYYAKRWTIEPGFRDTKDLRFGMGLSVLRIADPQRRDRLLLLNAFAIVLLTLLGAAGES